ncbi:MAG TPA: poly-beta-1,6-N-acetyl-D-glucosamine N-deacetylase PgaB [Burkholderiales bacterium]|nr:poly-beta-1,6-N-acetyl-D-glucosamine N-deacetylase PgaB [Burkholderiales bacterium]
MRALPGISHIAAGLLAALLGCGALAAAPGLTADRAPASAPPGLAPVAPPPGSFIVLSYHEVRDEVRDYPDPYAVDSGALVAQFAWLRGSGYAPVSLQAIIDARNGGKSLPPKAVLLTFDDGYLSFYTRVYPLLRVFGYPALLAVVGKWIDEPPQADQLYGEKATVGSAAFPTWAQLREMAGSGLVEMASHSYDLHRGILANPQGNVEPAATARLYDAASGSYENDAQWRARVRDDMERNSALIARQTGQRPRAMVWPYGSYNDELVRIAGELGMPVDITLNDGVNTPQVPLSAMRRLLVIHNPPLANFTGEVIGPPVPPPVRVVEVGLDQVVDADPARQEQKLSALLDRVLALGVTHVFLHAFSDSGAGAAPQAYFATQSMAMRADLFNRVAWQLSTRTDVKVCAAIPPSLLRMPPAAAAAIVQDLARGSNFEGLYFMPTGPGEAADSAAMVAASARLAQAARKWRAPLLVARGIAQADASAQTIASISAGADWVVLAQLRGAPPVAHFAGGDAAALAAGQPRLVVLLDGAGDGGALRAGAALSERMRGLQRAGAVNFGFRDDDFLRDEPPLAQIAPALSVRDTTFR